MPDTRLVLPYDVEGVILDVLKRRHPEHLAKVERQRSLKPRTFQQFNTMARMADASGLRLSGDTVPALLLATIGAPTFRRNEENGIDAVLQLGMQITVMGQGRRDTLMKRDVLTWTAIECMYQRMPRGSNGLINSVALTDIEPLAEADTQRVLGDSRLVWEIGVTNMLAISGGLPRDTSDWPASGGGAPEEPYDPVGPPVTATDVTVEIDRQPLVE